MRDGQVPAQSPHRFHLVAVYRMDHRTGAAEEQRLEKGVREEVEHGGGVALARMASHARNAERHHHIGDLRDGRKGEHPLDVGLRNGDHRGEQRREGPHIGNQRQHPGSCEEIEREHPRNEVDARHHHRGGMDECRHRGRSLHGIGQPDVQREHRRLAGRPHEEERHRPCGRREAEERTSRHRGHCQGGMVRRQQTEVERTRIVRQNQNADQKTQVGEPRHDERLFGGGYRGGLGVIEPNEQVGGGPHEFPENVHLENVGGYDQSEHREAEEREKSVVALEAAFALHVTEAVDVDHQRNGRNHDQHHHRDGVQQHAHVDVQPLAETQPLRRPHRQGTVNASLQPHPEEVAVGCQVGEHRGHGHSERPAQAGRTGTQPLAAQSDEEKHQHRNENDVYGISHTPNVSFCRYDGRLCCWPGDTR